MFTIFPNWGLFTKAEFHSFKEHHFVSSEDSFIGGDFFSTIIENIEKFICLFGKYAKRKNPLK